MTKSASLPFVMNVFSPVMIQSSPFRPGPDAAGIGARARLGDREAAAAVAVNGGDEVLLLLFLGPGVEDVVGGAAEPEGDEGAAGLHRDDR
jgi:hypothetical protein